MSLDALVAAVEAAKAPEVAERAPRERGGALHPAPAHRCVRGGAHRDGARFALNPAFAEEEEEEEEEESINRRIHGLSLKPQQRARDADDERRRRTSRGDDAEADMRRRRRAR